MINQNGTFKWLFNLQYLKSETFEGTNFQKFPQNPQKLIPAKTSYLQIRQS